MVVTDFGVAECALLMAGSGTIPRFCEIGSGSGTAVASLGSNIAPVLTRTDFTSRDIGVPNQVEWVHDFGRGAMSGIALREFGIGGSAALGTNDLWLREAFNAVEFDGSNELQIQFTMQIFN